jgi:release factor glutamine methyltransferase
MSSSNEPRTIRALLAATTPWLQKKGSPSARLDAELLIGHALKLRRLDLYLDLDRPLSDDEIERCRALVKRRGTGEPVAYVLGHREFWGLSLKVTNAVLVPRPETELLVELALKHLPDDVEGTIVDVGTGSGCIALALLSEREGLRAVAVDVSADALAIAAENAAAAGVADRIEFRHGDLLSPCADVKGARLVVSNPPYVRRGDPALGDDVARHEPALALYGEDDDALGHHRRIVATAPAVLADDGVVLLEIGAEQGAAARGLLAPPFASVDVVRDLSQLDRVVVLRR